VVVNTQVTLPHLNFEPKEGMPMYSEQEALDLIQQNPEQYKTLDSLRALADKVSLEASGKFTLLYGGQLGGLHTRTIVEALVNANEDEGGGGTLDNPQPPRNRGAQHHHRTPERRQPAERHAGRAGAGENTQIHSKQ
jgi:hypothetical protein